MPQPDYFNSHAYARLKEFLASDVPNSTGWYDAFCPLHDDSTRSAGFNFENGSWSCRKGCGSGRISDLINRLDAMDEADRGDAPEEESETTSGPDAEVIGLSSRKRRQNRPIPTDEMIEQWVRRLHIDANKLKRFIDRRGLSKETMLRAEIGWSDDDEAYTVPIRSASGSLANVRLYRINSQDTKIWSYGSAGMDASMIYPESVLSHNSTIVVCEGEWDAMMAGQFGIPAVTGTTGAEQWQRKWNQKFKGKDVYFVYDRDKSGIAGAEKASRALTGIARAVYIIELPMEYREKHGLDVSDYFNGGATKDDFNVLMANASIVSAPKDGAPIEVSVKESFNPALSGKPMSMVVSIVGKVEGLHVSPRDVTFNCGINADKKCVGCPMAEAGGTIKIEVDKESPVILKLRDVTDESRDDALRAHIGATKCGKMETFISSYHAVELLTARTSLDHALDEESDASQRPIVNVGEYQTDANRVVRLIGTTYPDPRTQTSVFQAWRLEDVESSLDMYEIDQSDIELLKTFRPRAGQTPLNKMLEIANDMADNVTKIVGRPAIHMAMDMVWHSVISFEFAGQPIERGWLELLIVGDARTGKSEVANKLSKHYGFGRVISCESASIPGLLGAVKPLPGNKGWVLEWGAIPLNDRRLLVLDEAGGLKPEQIGQLSSVRSSGRAEVIKAVAHLTHARTRLIWLSNPRDNLHGMGGYMYGALAIQPLIGNQEDIARFDFAMSVAADDVSLETINSRNLNPLPHRHSSVASKALIRWVWSRKKDDVVWAVGAEDAVYAASLEMGRTYVANPPLVQGQNIRTKIARLAVAIAARTFSTDSTYTQVVVRKVHVESAVKFLDWIYGMSGFGYKEVSLRQRAEERRSIAQMDDVKEYMGNRPGLARFLIQSGGEFRAQQLQEQLNYERHEGNVVIQKLAAMSMIKSNSEWTYRIMPHLNTVLREIKEK